MTSYPQGEGFAVDKKSHKTGQTVGTQFSDSAAHQ
jgi:hypothetical protein